MAESRWPFTPSDYIKDSGPFWSRLKPWDLIVDNIKGVLVVVGGTYAAAVQAVPNAVTEAINGLRSFAVDVVAKLFMLPRTAIREGFVQGVSEVANTGLAGTVAATLMVGLSAYVVGKIATAVLTGGS